MTKTFINFKCLRVYGNDTMITKNGELVLRKEKLPDGAPFVNRDKFKSMPQKCQQCNTILKNKKKYYIGKIVNLDSGFWTYEKICKRCENPNIRNN